MKKFLWNFSFQELFLNEGGEAVMDISTYTELESIQLLENYFERTAAKCRYLISNKIIDSDICGIEGLMNEDVAMQLCLIFALCIQESVFSGDAVIQQMEDNIPSYFKEYRTFAKSYDFEKYSLLYQLPSKNISVL